MPEEIMLMGTEEKEQVVYGRNAVLELLRQKPESVEKLYFQFNTTHPRIKEILITARRLRLVTGKARLEKLSQIAGSTKHQGVCALLTTVSFSTLEAVLASPRNTAPLFIVLQGLEDPHNVGAIIRTAEAAAADAVVLTEGRGAPVNAAVHKASAGALSHMRICKVKSLVSALECFRENRFRIFSADMEGELNYTDADLKGPSVIVLGAEGTGLSPEAMRYCDSAVRIPIAGCVESLNVSVSAGILLYEAMRQRLS